MPVPRNILAIPRIPSGYALFTAPHLAKRHKEQ